MLVRADTRQLVRHRTSRKDQSNQRSRGWLLPLRTLLRGQCRDVAFLGRRPAGTCLVLAPARSDRRHYRIREIRCRERHAGIPRSVRRCRDLGRGPHRQHGTPAVGIVHPAARYHPQTGNGHVPRCGHRIEPPRRAYGRYRQTLMGPSTRSTGARHHRRRIRGNARGSPRSRRFGGPARPGRRGRPDRRGPASKPMGKGAVRSQMDIRICLRIRERRDVDVILGQGSFDAGWHAHSLHPARRIPDLQPRACHTGTAPGLPDHR